MLESSITACVKLLVVLTGTSTVASTGHPACTEEQTADDGAVNGI